MKNFFQKWFISASSGLFGKLLYIVILLASGGLIFSLFGQSKYTPLIILLISSTVAYFFGFLSRNFHTIKEWAREARADKIEILEREIELQKLKNEEHKMLRENQALQDGQTGRES